MCFKLKHQIISTDKKNDKIPVTLQKCSVITFFYLVYRLKCRHHTYTGKISAVTGHLIWNSNCLHKVRWGMHYDVR